MSATASSSIHCPNSACQKPLISQVALAEGSRFVVKCAHCQRFVKIIAGFKHIEKRLLLELHEQRIISIETNL